MSDQISSIRPPIIDNYARIIQSLIESGRTGFIYYLVQPLTKWSGQVPVEPLDRLLSLIDQGIQKKSSRLPLLFKMALVKSVAPDQFDMNIPGKIVLDFLRVTRGIPSVAMSNEALEFFNLLRDSFREYSEKEFQKMNKKFESEISSADTVEVEKLIKIHEGNESRARAMVDESKKGIEEIARIHESGNLGETKRAIVNHLLKYADPAMPELHKSIFTIIEKISRDNTNFKKDVFDTAAVITYHEILKAIKDKRLENAVKFIGKYTVLFRGDPNTPNYREVDTFEKQFFQIIEKKNLWDRI
ncbi:MAG: hypothetical protein MUD12_08285 [Spirochaetes bacterium]|jgi:hypothetical protein|nr:hypothetical protein [Spirochaetota bacterium]